MKMLPKLPKNSKTLIAAGSFLAVVSALAVQNGHLRSNLNSTTRITQSLRAEVDRLRLENAAFQESTKSETSQIETLNAEIGSLKKSAGQHEDLKKQAAAAEKKLAEQNSKIAHLEEMLKETEAKMRWQKKTSANLERQTRSAKSNPGMTSEYVKLVENEWLAAVAKTEDVEKYLAKTLAELASYNKERNKLRNETAIMHYNIAVILAEQKNYGAAVREYLKVLEIRPDDADAHYNLAILYDEYEKNGKKALEHYRRYVELAPDTPESHKVRRWIKDREFESSYPMKF